MSCTRVSMRGDDMETWWNKMRMGRRVVNCDEFLELCESVLRIHNGEEGRSVRRVATSQRASAVARTGSRSTAVAKRDRNTSQEVDKGPAKCENNKKRNRDVYIKSLTSIPSGGRVTGI